MRAHLQNEDRQRQDGDNGKADFQTAQFGFAPVRLITLGRIGGDLACLVARLLDRFRQGGGRGGVAGDTDGGPLRCEINARIGNTRNGLQCLFDAPDAGGAGHALNVEFNGLLIDAISRMPDCIDNGEHIRRPGKRNIGAFRRQIDRGLQNPRHLGDRLLHTTNARGACHPIDGYRMARPDLDL